MSRRITDQVAAWVEESLDSLLLGDTATFETSIVLTPSGPALLVLLAMPSLVLGESIQVAAMMENPAGVSAQQVEGLVSQSLESMRGERSKQAAAPAAGPSSLLVAGRG